jgi:PAS domain S-box-containing protein
MTFRRTDSVIDNLGVGVAQLKLDGTWLSANRRLCALLGYPKEELLAISFDWLFRLADVQMHEPEHPRLVNGVIDSYASERAAGCKDGRTICVRVTFSLERDQDTAEPVSILAVIEDLTALRSADEAVLKADAARREVAQRLTAAQENERTRIARELHDDIGQSLAILRIQMMRAGQPVSGMPGKAHPGLSELSAKLKDIAQKVSQLSHQLHSSELDYLGFAAAVQSHCREFSEKFKIAVDCSCQGIPSDLDGLLALGLLRVVQEALHNAAKHSQAKSIEVRVLGSPGGLSLVIADNGVGFDVEEARLAPGLGLISMRERIYLAGGEFTIASEPGHGTRITARVPMEEA